MQFENTQRAPLTHDVDYGVVELGFFVPRGHADALINLARQRRQSVGEILRELIQQEIVQPSHS